MKLLKRLLRIIKSLFTKKKPTDPRPPMHPNCRCVTHPFPSQETDTSKAIKEEDENEMWG